MYSLSCITHTVSLDYRVTLFTKNNILKGEHWQHLRGCLTHVGLISNVATADQCTKSLEATL